MRIAMFPAKSQERLQTAFFLWKNRLIIGSFTKNNYRDNSLQEFGQLRIRSRKSKY